MMTDLQNKCPTEKPLGIYIHIPFCVSKCIYCDFYSLPCKNKDLKITVSKYTDALISHIEKYGEILKSRTVSTIFIGGGTPTCIGTDELLKIIKAVKNTFRCNPQAEFTIESNPGTFDKSKISALKNAGVNRLSMGMQSANENELKTLNRIHSFEDTKNAVKLARECGISNISLDLMYGIPFQTIESFANTLEKAVSLSPEHISVYGLQIEKGTPLQRNLDKYVFPDEDEEYELNKMARVYLSEHNYNRYEISNYSKSGFECTHNLNYWNLCEFIGFGTGAYSYFGNRRFYIEKNVEKYINTKNFDEVTKTDEILSPEETAVEYAMVRLRLTRGLNLLTFKEMTPNADFYINKAKKYVDYGFMKLENNHLFFTPDGFNISNSILSDILF